MGNAPSKSSPQVQNDTLDSTYCDKSGWMPVGTFDSDKVRTLYEILSEIRDRGDRLFKAIDRKLMIKYRNQWKLGSLTVSKQSEELREGMALRGWMYRLDVVMVGDNGWHKGKQKNDRSTLGPHYFPAEPAHLLICSSAHLLIYLCSLLRLQ